ncbi:MAG: exosome complex RNA-binding protein Rrp4 [Candidatus Woesearchaeota archaeon]
MSELFVKDKDVVAPGEVLATGMDYIPARGAYRQGDNIVANEVGLIQINGRAIKLIPISGKYLPKVDDVIICKVIDITMSGWRVDTNSAYSGMIGLKDGSNEFIQRGANLTKYFNIDDYVVAKVLQVTSQMLIDLSAVGQGLRKLRGGQILQVECKKVPRIIGKQGSMVSLIKEYTGCHITVGQNGRVWISGSPEGQVLAVKTIKKIVAEAHHSGLTDTIKQYLDDNKLDEAVFDDPQKSDTKDDDKDSEEEA